MIRMRKMWKIAIFFGASALCLAASFWLGLAYQARSCNVVSAMVAGKVLVSEADDLEKIYVAGSSEEKEHRLEHFAVTLELLRTDIIPLLGEHSVSRDLALTYARLALIHRQRGNKQKEAEYLKKAVQIYPTSEGELVTADKIVQMVQALDRGIQTKAQNPEAQKGQQ
jgi:tetratricopeptide (TPR) repeat protein